MQTAPILGSSDSECASLDWGASESLQPVCSLQSQGNLLPECAEKPLFLLHIATQQTKDRCVFVNDPPLGHGANHNNVLPWMLSP